MNIPFDNEVERSLLGSLIVDGSYMPVIRPVIKVGDFFNEVHQIIYSAMLKLDVIDEVTVAVELNRMGKLDEVGAHYLINLKANCPTSIHAEYYAEIVHRMAFNRAIISASSQVAEVGYQDNDCQKALDKLNDIYRSLSRRIIDKTIYDSTRSFDDALVRYSEARETPLYLPTGIKNFDTKKGGLLPGEYMVLAGRAHMGKTTLGLQIARHVAQVKTVLVFSLEMSGAQVTNKNISGMTGIDEEKISLGKYSEVEHRRMVDALSELHELKLFVAEGNRDIDSIRRETEKIGNSSGLDMVIIDYLQRIRHRTGNSQYERVGEISYELATMTKDYKIPFIVLAQLNRDAEYREDKRPKLSDLRDSGKIEEDADMVAILYRDSYYQNESTCNPFASELHIWKDRLRGHAGKIDLGWKEGKYW